MNTNFSVAMYHYVRELSNTRYPAIKGLDLNLFREQLRYFRKHYNFVNATQLIDAFYHGAELPPKSIVLTFDDAYADHYTNVFPLLDEYKIQGFFFAPVKAITKHEVLIVNKIHFILAVCDTNIQRLLDLVKKLLSPFEGKDGVLTFDIYFSKLAKPNRYDSKEVIFVKRLLQVELKEPVRSIIVNRLFKEYVTSDESAFSRELYMSEDQLRCMIRNGMIVGSHGYDHFWLSSLTNEQQRFEIGQSVDFLKRIGAPEMTLSIGYPYGDHNAETLKIAHDYGFQLGFTTEIDVASSRLNNSLEIPRLDTNDFPKDSEALPNEWYQKG